MIARLLQLSVLQLCVVMMCAVCHSSHAASASSCAPQVHASMTENYLIGKSLDNVQTLQST